MRSKVKITVVRVLARDDVFGQKIPAKCDESLSKVCHRHKEGEEFVVPEDGTCPPGFCNWAYADIHRDITHLRLGGDFPWMQEMGVAVVCCTDGLRPVFFRLERVQ